MTKLMQFLVDNTQPKISKQHLAKQLKVHPSLITLWMKGERNPGRSKLKILSKVTGIAIEDLV